MGGATDKINKLGLETSKTFDGVELKDGTKELFGFGTVSRFHR